MTEAIESAKPTDAEAVKTEVIENSTAVETAKPAAKIEPASLLKPKAEKPKPEWFKPNAAKPTDAEVAKPEAKPSAPVQQTEVAKVEEEESKPPVKAPEPASSSEPAKAAVVRVLHDFPLSYGNGLHKFTKDQIVTDPLVAKFMLDNGCPVIRVEETIDFQVCPKCHHHF